MCLRGVKREKTPGFLRHASSASGRVAFVSLASHAFPFRVSLVDFSSGVDDSSPVFLFFFF